MKKKVLTCGLMLICATSFAQPARGNPGGSPTPIDGGLSLLLAAGAALGGKFIHDQRKKKEE